MTPTDNGSSDEATKIIVPRDNQETEQVTTDEYFGGCPKCGKADGYRNVGKSHWNSCTTHMTCWFMGSGLFSCWQEENEEIWARNAKALQAYEVVKPVRAASRVNLASEKAQVEFRPVPEGDDLYIAKITGIDAWREAPGMSGPTFKLALVKQHAKAGHIEHAFAFNYTLIDPVPTLYLPENMVFSWVHANPDVGPAFLARVLPLLDAQKCDAPDRAFHPLVIRLLNEFGDRQDVRDSLAENIFSSASALCEQPLRSLSVHPIGAVRCWAEVMLTGMQRIIDSAKVEDAH